jgi:hypothetical protein
VTWDRHNFQEKIEDTTGVIRIRKSKKDRRYGQNEKDKRTNNNLQNTTEKTKDRVTQTSLKTGCEFMCSGRLNISCSTSGTRHVTLVTNPINAIFK